MSDKISRYVSEDLQLRLVSVNATEVVEHMRKTQNTYPLSTVALGRAMVGALLMASHLKGEQELSLDFQVDGPIQRVYAQANVQGGVRGYVFNPGVSLQPGQNNLDLKEAMGSGFLTVTTYLPHQETPHRGTVELFSGEIGEDIAQYYQNSMQRPTMVSVGVSLDSAGKVAAAAGALVEVMPGADEKLIQTLESNLKNLKGPSQALVEGQSPEEWVRSLAGTIKLNEIPHPHHAHYSCPCDHQRVLRSLGLLEDEEIKEAIATGEVIKVQCQMCGTWYTAGPEELKAVQEIKARQSVH